MQKIRWAIIGAGGIADRRTIPGIMADDGSELAAVMDANEKTAKNVGKKYGVPYFTDERAMLESTDCDAVYIATPVFCHYDQAMLALEFGRHVLLEKPVTRKTDEAAKLVDAFKNAGKMLSVGYMMKYHNLHVKAKELIEAQAIGKVVDVRALFSCWYPDIPGAWRQKKELGGGGAFIDLGVHCAELIEYILGEEIVDVKSFYNTQTFSYEVEDSAVVIFKTSSGILGHIDCNFNVDLGTSPSRLEFYGTAGNIICERTMSQKEEGTLKHIYAPQAGYEPMQNEKQPDGAREYSAENGNIYTKQIKAFCDAIKCGSCDYTDAERALHIQKIVDKVYADN